MGGLDCIAGLSSKDSLDNSTFVGRRKLGGMATMVIFFVWLYFLKDPSHSGVLYINLGCNVSAGTIKRSKRDNIILLSSREIFDDQRVSFNVLTLEHKRLEVRMIQQLSQRICRITGLLPGDQEG